MGRFGGWRRRWSLFGASFLETEQEFLDRLAEYRLGPFRRDLAEWTENELSLLHAGVGKRQPWRVQDDIVQEQQVEIEGA